MLIEQIGDWHPAGTLLISSAAVLIGYRVGRLQSASHAQQADAQDTPQSAALFNSRLDVFIATQAYIHETLRTAKRPSQETSEAFVSAKIRATLLFSPPVSEKLAGLNRLAEGLFALTDSIEQTSRQDQWLTEAKRQQSNALQWLTARAFSLPKMFEPELSPFGSIAQRADLDRDRLPLGATVEP